LNGHRVVSRDHKNILKKMESHILNGDALKEGFPDSLPGEIIVMRECLVDGNVSGNGLDELLDNRAAFLKEAYGARVEEYRKKTISEVEKIKRLPPEAQVNLWFEDDLFCQVNLWFTAWLLAEFTSVQACFLVRPTAELRFGFGGMDTSALVSAYQRRQEIRRENLLHFRELWLHYQAGQHQEMAFIAENLKEAFPFLREAVRANTQRFPADRSAGRPEASLRAIMEEVGHDQFGPVFQVFSKQESIYGYGDLQVKRLFEKIRSNG